MIVLNGYARQCRADVFEFGVECTLACGYSVREVGEVGM